MSGVALIQDVYGKIAAQDIPGLMALLHDDIRWTINAADPGPVPWFGDFRGKDEVPKFFQGLGAVEWKDFSPRAVVGDDNTVMALLHVAFEAKSGKTVDMLEVHVWGLRDGKVASLDALEDTAAVRDALS